MHRSSIAKSGLTLEIQLQISSFVAFFLLLALGPVANAQTPAEILSKMSIEEKIGQMMIWSFSGDSLDISTKEILKKYQPGALIAFRRNITTNDQIARFNSSVQTFAKKNLKAPLFLMIDQEGGVVSRIKMRTPTPSALALGKTGDSALVFAYAKTSAEVLSSLGFNVNLAPVLDISNPAKDSFIGNRTFGNDPQQVSEFGVAYAKGLSTGGVLPTAKHFPGHGDTLQDSHRMTPKKNSTIEDLEKRDLIPFRKFASESFINLIMSAHLSLPSIDPSGLPATYSSLILQDQLRERYAYKGLVITDDLEMSGAMVSSDVGERAIKAILAGNDMIMLAGTHARQKRAYDQVYRAIKAGRLTEERINESVLRILEAKRGLSPSLKLIEPKRLTAAIRKLEEFSKEIMHKNFDIAVREQRASLPQTSVNTRVLVVGSSISFFNSFKNSFPGRARFFHLTPESLDASLSAMNRTKADFVVFYASGSKTARWLEQMPSDIRSKTVVINCNHPGELAEQKSFMAVLNINGHSPESGAWLAETVSSAERRDPATVAPDEG